MMLLSTLKSIHSCILLTLWLMYASGEELTCWSGHDTSMSKQVCSPATTTRHEETGSPNGTISDSKAGKAFCYEMMYQESGGNSTLSFQKSHVAGRLTHINASCDTELLCNSTNAWKSVQTVINDVEVTLFCCDKNNCNKNKTFPALIPVCNRMLYNGTAAVVSREICRRAEDVCISHAQYQKERLLSQVFSCAPAKDCRASADIEQHPQCYNETINGLVKETCCCHGDFCIPLPPNISITEFKDNNDTSPPMYVDVTHHKVLPKSKPGTDWLFVGGLIAAAVLVVVIVASVVTVWQIKKRREAAARNQMMLSYTPISSSEVENGDLQMLI